MALSQSAHRLVTYALFAGLAIAALVLEKQFHEMHVSKLLFFAAFGVWARELDGVARGWLLFLVGVLWLMVISMWLAYPHQHLVPVGNGVYRIEN